MPDPEDLREDADEAEESGSEKAADLREAADREEEADDAAREAEEE